MKKRPGAGYDEAPDPLAIAREDMLNRMRARMEGPAGDPVPALYPKEGPAGGPAPDEVTMAVADPLAGLGDDAQSAADVAALDAGTSAGGAAPSDLAGDLLDVFRDAKQDTEEGTLASEVDDVSISDLLGDVRGISSRLGVKPAQRREEPVIAAEQGPEEQPELSLEEPEPEIQIPQNLRQLQFPEEEETAEGEPELSMSPDVDERYEDPPQGSAKGPGSRFLLHVVFLGLAVTMGAGLGVKGAASPLVFANAQATPSVLAYLNPPVVPPAPLAVGNDAPEVKALQKDARAVAPTPSPSPTPVTTPTPEPRSYPFTADQPAWTTYRIESGDSLSSIATDFGVCPDHILWNNPGRKEEDRLLVGDKLIMPGYPGIVYRMQKGETLSEVAARYSTTVDMVLAYPGNHLQKASDAREGTIVLLPDAIPPSALLQDADAQWAYTHPSDYGYIWPFYGPITTYYGEVRPGYVHNAIDIGGLGHFGAPVLAAAAGQVDTVEDDLQHGLGRYVIISHADGSRTVYGHMSDVYVKAGDYVSQGEPVGALGCTGHSTGTHLHFELWINGGPVDPLAYLP
ncbi:MAG TPA: M23 family metallopeptidase [Dehalococcoidia bacterium]|nr:M23 family metallopeptidase [Dehalococcoidia bacterium]